MVRRLMLGLALLVLGGLSSACGAAPAPAPAAVSTPSPKPPVADASCEREAQSHSLNSNTPTSFTITNKTSERLTLYWLDFQGKRVKYFDLASGMTQTQPTFVTHPWVVADPGAACLYLFTVSTAPPTITIR